MKRLILDHYRRWRWVLGPAALYVLVQGWFLATPLNYHSVGYGKVVSFAVSWLKVQSMMIEFSLPVTATLLGAFLLSLDLQRGLLRPLATLPATGRQIGRAWWRATVLIPAVATAGLLVTGAATFHLFHLDSSQAFPTQVVAKVSLLCLLLFGATFTIYLNKLAPAGTRWGATFNFVLAVSSIWMFFGYLLSAGASKSPIKFGVFLCVSGLLTVVGWYRSEHFSLGRGPHGSFIIPTGLPHPRTFTPAPGRPGFRLTPLEPRAQPLSPVAGPCGVPFLIGTTFVRTFSAGLAMLTLMLLIWLWQGTLQSWREVIRTFGAMSGVFWMVVFLLLLPLLQHLRCLRTLPLSSTRLAIVILVLGLLPLPALGALSAALAWATMGSAAAFTVLRDCVFSLAPAAVCLCVAIWRGSSLPTYLSALVTMLAFYNAWLRIALYPPSTAFLLVGALAAGCLLVAFFLIRLTLRRSSHAYRVRGGLFGLAPVGAPGQSPF